MTEEIKNTEVAVVSDTGFSNLVVVSEDKDFIVYQKPDGKFERKMKYHAFSSIITETREEKVALMKLRDKAEEMKNYIGKEILLEGVIISPYTSLDEETGDITHGATTTLITDNFTKAVVTSSKTVYFKIRELLEMFGEDLFNEGDQLTIRPITEKGQNYNLTTIELVS
mgnify:CR=1 FL=1